MLIPVRLYFSMVAAKKTTIDSIISKIGDMPRFNRCISPIFEIIYLFKQNKFNIACNFKASNNTIIVMELNYVTVDLDLFCPGTSSTGPAEPRADGEIKDSNLGRACYMYL